MRRYLRIIGLAIVLAGCRDDTVPQGAVRVGAAKRVEIIEYTQYGRQTVIVLRDKETDQRFLAVCDGTPGGTPGGCGVVPLKEPEKR